MSKIAKRFISYIGKAKLEDIKDAGLRSITETYCEDQEKKDNRIKQAAIRGTEFHKSHDDPTDEKDVLAIRFLDEDGKRVGTGHLHKDGTSKFRYKKTAGPSSGFE